jgi:hypoxanthine-DNA glycosylase
MGAFIDSDLVLLLFEARLETLLAAGVGLWDVVASARRQGSLDAAIRDHSANALPEFAAGLPRLRAIGFNGGTSARLGIPALSDSGVALLPLPSSSPAYTLSFERKLMTWMALRPYLD